MATKTGGNCQREDRGQELRDDQGPVREMIKQSRALRKFGRNAAGSTGPMDGPFQLPLNAKVVDCGIILALAG